MDESQRDWLDTFGVEPDVELPEPDESEEPECTWAAL
jgi:hypothetical protein